MNGSDTGAESPRRDGSRGEDTRAGRGTPDLDLAPQREDVGDGTNRCREFSRGKVSQPVDT